MDLIAHEYGISHIHVRKEWTMMELDMMLKAIERRYKAISTASERREAREESLGWQDQLNLGRQFGRVTQVVV